MDPLVGDPPKHILRLSGTPVKFEIVTQVKNEIFHLGYLAALDGNNSHATVFTYPSFAVRQMDIPVHGNDIVSGERKDVADTDMPNVELDFRELVEEVSKPALDSTLPSECAACMDLPGVDEDPVIPPSRHKPGKVMPVQRLERTSYCFSGNKCSNHEILLSEGVYPDENELCIPLKTLVLGVKCSIKYPSAVSPNTRLRFGS
jgi:hypothetical protein